MKGEGRREKGDEKTAEDAEGAETKESSGETENRAETSIWREFDTIGEVSEACAAARAWVGSLLRGRTGGGDGCGDADPGARRQAGSRWA